MVTGASSNGGLYARNGAVTLDTNNVNAGLTCPGAQAQLDPPCTFQEYVCGQTLLDNGYLIADLRTAYDVNPIAPTIPDTLLNKVLYLCMDTIGTVIGNSYCIVGCAAVGDNLKNDMCTM